MLELKNISKTFNAGTVNQKVALNGLNLTLECTVALMKPACSPMS